MRFIITNGCWYSADEFRLYSQGQTVEGLIIEALIKRIEELREEINNYDVSELPAGLYDALINEWILAGDVIEADEFTEAILNDAYDQLYQAFNFAHEVSVT